MSGPLTKSGVLSVVASEVLYSRCPQGTENPGDCLLRQEPVIESETQGNTASTEGLLLSELKKRRYA